MTEQLTDYSEEERQLAVQALLKRREYNRCYYHGHKDKAFEQSRLYRQGHREEIRQYDNRLYKEKLRGKKQAYSLRYYREHHQEVLEYWHRRNKEHPEIHRDANRRRRARLADADGNFTQEEFQLLCDVFGNRCTYCHQELPLGPDHIIPLSRGGSNSIDNITPACATCNKQKGTKTYDEFMAIQSCIKGGETWQY